MRHWNVHPWKLQECFLQLMNKQSVYVVCTWWLGVRHRWSMVNSFFSFLFFFSFNSSWKSNVFCEPTFIWCQKIKMLSKPSFSSLSSIIKVFHHYYWSTRLWCTVAIIYGSYHYSFISWSVVWSWTGRGDKQAPALTFSLDPPINLRCMSIAWKEPLKKTHVPFDKRIE